MDSASTSLFLAGDVMTGRGIDDLLTIADPSAIWGDVLEELAHRSPDVRIGNLETAVTTSDTAWPNKRFRFRMHPDHTPCLVAAGFHCLTLANNHVLDWGYEGLAETLSALSRHGISTTGAGPDLGAASAPVALNLAKGRRVVVFAWAHPSSYTPKPWAATADRAGVNLLTNLDRRSIAAIKRQIDALRKRGDLIVASIHWGPNWGYEVAFRQRRFAHRLIDRAGVDVIYGHSSHHPMAVEIYRGRPILYGCGDLINDYGRRGETAPFRPEIAALYFLRMDARSRTLAELILVPMRIDDQCLRRASAADAQWLCNTLNRGGPPVAAAARLGRLRRLRRTRFRHGWMVDENAALALQVGRRAA